MARIRTIKPEFWSSEQIMECSPMARLLFIGMWNFCDDGGNHPASAKTLKAEIFPSDDMLSSDVQRLLDELSSNGLITLYTASNKDFWHVNGWHHQKIDRPTFKYPPFSAELSNGARRGLDDQSPPEGKGRVKEGEEEGIGNGKEEGSSAYTSNVGGGGQLGHAPPEEHARSVQIAVLLRGAGIKPMSGMHPLAVEWAENPKITDQLLHSALQTMRDRKPQGDVSPNYLKPIIDELLNPPQKPTKPQEDAWWRSREGIERKGKELGLFARGTESYDDFKDRIFEEIRRREGATA